MKVKKYNDINLNSHIIFHVNKNHYNSIIYYKDNIYTTIYKNPIDLYNMFITYEKYILFFCQGLISLIEENGLLKGYEMRKSEGKVKKSDAIKYIYQNKNIFIEFMQKSKYYYCDLDNKNMIYIDNNISLIDLDSFRKINKYNWNCYLNRYPDLKNAFGSNLKEAQNHYFQYGIYEGRDYRCKLEEDQRTINELESGNEYWGFDIDWYINTINTISMKI